MSHKNVIAVIGAVQGGSVDRFLLNDGTFTVRAITRNPDSPAAKELAMRGAEVAKADSRELESLQNAFEGTYGVFAVTNFWEEGVGSMGEITQGKLLVDAATPVPGALFPMPHGGCTLGKFVYDLGGEGGKGWREAGGRDKGVE